MAQTPRDAFSGQARGTTHDKFSGASKGPKEDTEATSPNEKDVEKPSDDMVGEVEERDFKHKQVWIFTLLGHHRY